MLPVGFSTRCSSSSRILIKVRYPAILSLCASFAPLIRWYSDGRRSSISSIHSSFISSSVHTSLNSAPRASLFSGAA